MQGPSVQEIVMNENVEIRFDRRVRTAIRIKADRPDIMIHDRKRREVILIEVGITNQEELTAVETGKKRKYDVLASKVGSEMKCRTKTIPYAMTCDGIGRNLYKRYAKEIIIPDHVGAYIQLVLKKTLQNILVDDHHGI
ncbi:unnamed protein product [Thelazia callipaeda]|uniref:Transposase n=1 Tax=Thelazia callipaeda TaxID=103827 RepID=A0A0N5CYV0_THECL|nr:unnamed protein product [Thelazia callipaeda]